MMEDKRKLDDKELEQVSGGGAMSDCGDCFYKGDDSNDTEIPLLVPSINEPQQAGTYYIMLQVFNEGMVYRGYDYDIEEKEIR